MPYEPNDDDVELHLSKINTSWSLVAKAGASADNLILQELLRRYGRAVYDFLKRLVHWASIRDPSVTEDLYQDFSLRLVQGKLALAKPEKGRFRDYLKAICWKHPPHLPRRQQKHRVASCRTTTPDPWTTKNQAKSMSVSSAKFSRSSPTLAMERLAEVRKPVNPTLHQALSLRQELPNLSNTQLAETLSQRLGVRIDTECVGRRLHKGARNCLAAS